MAERGDDMDYNFCKAVLNGEVECSFEEYDEVVRDTSKCIDLLIEVAKLVNEPSRMSTLTVEKIRKQLNCELKESKENYIPLREW